MSDTEKSAEVIIRVIESGDMAYKVIGNPRLYNALIGSMKVAENDIIQRYLKCVNFGLEIPPFDNSQLSDKNAGANEISGEVEVERSEAIDIYIELRQKIEERLQAISKSESGTKFKIDLQSLLKI